MMSVALRGNLEDFGIADVFQLVGQQRKTGILEFKRDDGRQVQLRFDRGAVVSAAPSASRAHESLGDMLVRCGFLTREQVEALLAECEVSAQALPRLAVARGWVGAKEAERVEELLTRETIFEVMRWSNGSFDFRAQEVAHDRAFETLLGAEQILMDGLRMVDEWQSFSDHIPSEDTVFQRVGRFETYREQVSGEMARHIDDAERVFFLIDGRLTVRRIIDLSLLGTFDGMRVLAALSKVGIIEALDRAGLAQMRRRQRPIVFPRTTLRGWIGLLVPLAMLSLVTIAMQREHVAREAPGVLAFPASALDLAREDHATRRVRHALEAYRFADGRWPETLWELSAQGFLDRDALASDQGRPYYYVKREEGVVLLAPER